MALFPMMHVMLTWASALMVSAADIELSKDDTRITADTRIKPGTYHIGDTQADGAVQISGDGITVDFAGAELIGAPEDAAPDSFSGRGIVIRGKQITLRNAKVRGYKVGIYAENAPGLVIEDVDVSRNYQQRLKSTPEREDGADWLFPHNNDDQEWTKNHGAGISIARSDGITIRRVRAHNGQNGILLDRVNDSKIYDNDCSFLSGWGLGLWRCNRNVISRNAFDFCVRGYSHGVYNRGEDSAGILMFEQNNDNVIAENSATHGGDCFFGFAGREALGEDWLERERERLRKETGKQEVDDQLQYPPELLEKYRRRGNNNNLLINNDFSYAPAHGIEMTFSFGNKFIGNRLVGNAICGVWGGYSQQTLIDGNDFEGNGEGAYGLERGGVNIEHGRQNAIINNHFKNNKCGVHLWWDPDEGLLRTPWGKANDPLSADNRVVGNTFEGDELVLQLRECRNTLYAGNQVSGVRKELECSPGSEPVMSESVTEAEVKLERPQLQVLGQTRPVGARKQLAGRQNIIITEWGPYDFSRVTVVPPRVVGGAQATLQVLGPSGRFKVESVKGDVKVTPMEGDLPGKLTIQSEKPGVHPFSLQIDAGGTRLSATGSLMQAEWTVKYFVWHPSSDPREDQKAWDELLNGEPRDVQHVGAVDFVWGGGAPTPKVPSDHFGTLATTTLSLPAGKWRIHTVSDDGIRAWIDDQKVIDDWTWHPPKENDATVELKEGAHNIRIEHFEIDGYAQLQFRLEPEP